MPYRFDNKHIKRYPQGIRYYVGDKKRVVCYDGLNERFCLIDEPYGGILPAISLSDACVMSGLVESRAEFKRKLKEGAIHIWNWHTQLPSTDFQIPWGVEAEYEVRLGPRVMEILVPADQYKWWRYVWRLLKARVVHAVQSRKAR